MAGMAVVALAAVLIFGVLSYYSGSRKTTHVSVNRMRYPVKGIDVSYHNGEIDFEAVAADTVSFVYIKATEGGTWQDSCFTRNFDAARAAGLLTGAYHFFRFDVSGLRQAYNFIDGLQGRRPDLPLAIDLEEWKNVPDVTTADVIDRLAVMVDRLQAEGYKVMIYTNKSGYSRFLHRGFEDLDIWICSFTDPPTGGPWRFWQHSHQGRVRGIKGKVDMNTFNGGAEDFAEYLRGI
ncbi:MAG: hypothetical protein K2H03_02325 [Muribaculaceae bacterium]|nr:hypothetical protein [Muribaculaceae bacterium]